MAVLDSILIKNLIDTPTTVNSDHSTISIDISNRQDEFSVQIDYDNGVSVDMILVLEVSNDNVTFVPMASQAIVDASGTHIFDAAGTGTTYLRVSITVNGGSIDLQKVLYRAKRLH